MSLNWCLFYSKFSLFFHTYNFIQFVPITEPAVILSFGFAMFAYRLYKPAMFGSLRLLPEPSEQIVIIQNGGKMPVFRACPTCPVYVTTEMFGTVDSLANLGDADTKFKILTDYIDFGYSILSPGDVLIHLFACIMLYFMIVAVNDKSGLKHRFKGETIQWVILQKCSGFILSCLPQSF